MIRKIDTEFCELSIYAKYAIIKVFENVFYDLEKATIVHQKFQEFFKNQPFVLITERSFKHEVDLSIYKANHLNNLKGLAIVSADPKERDRAITEQPLFENSFAFFEKLTDAENWAQAFFR